jgi:hypothetical protein
MALSATGFVGRSYSRNVICGSARERICYSSRIRGSSRNGVDAVAVDEIVVPRRQAVTSMNDRLRFFFFAMNGLGAVGAHGFLFMRFSSQLNLTDKGRKPLGFSLFTLFCTLSNFVGHIALNI